MAGKKSRVVHGLAECLLSWDCLGPKLLAAALGTPSAHWGPLCNFGQRRKNYSLSMGCSLSEAYSLSLGGCLIIALTEVYCRAEKLSEVLR